MHHTSFIVTISLPLDENHVILKYKGQIMFSEWAASLWRYLRFVLFENISSYKKRCS